MKHFRGFFKGNSVKFCFIDLVVVINRVRVRNYRRILPGNRIAVFKKEHPDSDLYRNDGCLKYRHLMHFLLLPGSFLN